MKFITSCILLLLSGLLISPILTSAAEVPVPTSFQAVDFPLDDGTKINVLITIPPVQLGEQDQLTYTVERAEEREGLYTKIGSFNIASSSQKLDLSSKELQQQQPKETQETVTAIKCKMDQDYFFRIRGIDSKGNKSEFVYTQKPVQTSLDWFTGSSFKKLVYLLIFCVAVVIFIILARSGADLYVRKISGLEAIDEAVGRATEMGKPCLFVPGVQDLNDIQTIAGVTILSRVTQTAADFEAHVEVPTSRSLVMTAARETMQAAYFTAGRPEAYNQDRAYYVTDEQFGYVAYLTGYMVREKPAACFYFGSFFAESLILAETGNSIGAIQIAGTAQYSQLPFFVAACDYTLIGEELFAASAYLSGSPEELGSLKGQDAGKVFIFLCLIVGTIMSQFNPELTELLFK